MPTAKAKYVDDGSGEFLADFTGHLKQQLGAFYPGGESVEPDHCGEIRLTPSSKRSWGDAWWAKSALNEQGFELTNAEVQAEHADLLKSLRTMESKLRNLSL